MAHNLAIRSSGDSTMVRVGVSAAACAVNAQCSADAFGESDYHVRLLRD